MTEAALRRAHALTALTVREEKAMGKITHEGKTYNFDDIRNQMDESLSERLEGTTDSDQDFFDSYLVEHHEKFGERFTVR
jgi:hypothetical protein